MACLDPITYSYKRLTDLFAERYGKGEYHAGALFRALYRRGTAAVADLPEYWENQRLAEEIEGDFSLRLPEIRESVSDGSSMKLLLIFPDGAAVEAVILFMSRYATLCVSTQVGCARGCSFCETGKLGLRRNLTAGEIVSQVMLVRFVLGIRPSNLVYMGMGEPFDNYRAVTESLRILCDQRGLNIPASAATISTAGHAAGIRRLTGEINAEPNGPLGRVKLAVSLHTAREELRSQLMPINRVYPLDELRAAMASFPLPRRRDQIFIEYTLIPGLNDAERDVAALADYLRELPSCVNIIPVNRGSDQRYRSPTRDEVELFFNRLCNRGQYCRVRDTKGDAIMAACGQLGNLAAERFLSAKGFDSKFRV